MGILNVLLLVFFVIVAILLILLVLIQNEEGDSLGGIFAGGSGSAFGSRSGNILTRATTVLGTLFLALCLSLALINRTPGGTGVEAAGRQLDTGAGGSWWQEDAAPPADSDSGSDSEFIINGPGADAPVPPILQEDAPAGEASADSSAAP
jgi:preprotein translocase subunit SecG